MKDINENLTDDTDSMISDTSDESLHFLCPNDGEVSRDDVLFLCNTCDSSELVEKEGVYMCPSCLVPGENFECVLCGSTEVTLKEDASKPESA